jgi:Protein of unknown function (DUF1236)
MQQSRCAGVVSCRLEAAMPSWFTRVGCAVLFAGAAFTALAQDSPPRDLPRLDLTPAQKQTIHQSVLNRQDKKSTAPDTFRAAVGANVPDTVKLEPMPKTIVELIPQTKDFEYGLVSNQVLIVEPQSRRVVEIIVEAGG